jgi:hypothetical protein
VGDWRWRVRGAVSFEKKERAWISSILSFPLCYLFSVTHGAKISRNLFTYGINRLLPLPSPFAAFLLKKIVVGRKA